jgi:hypothetical protein
LASYDEVPSANRKDELQQIILAASGDIGALTVPLVRDAFSRLALMSGFLK